MFKWMKSAAIVAALAMPLMSLGSAPAEAGLVKLGVLKCKVREAGGFILNAHRELKCRYDPVAGRHHEHYYGRFSRIGINLGATDRAALVWIVFAVGDANRPNALSGDYYGGSAEATFGIGAGAHALIGGFLDTIVLQPVSLQGQTGIGVGAGLARLRLVPK